MLRESKKNFLIDLAFLLTVVAIVYFVFKFLAAYLLPFVIALIIALLIQKPTSFVSKHTKMPKGICSVILVLLTYIIVASLLTLLGYFVYSLMIKIATALPYVFNELSETWNIITDSVNEMMSHMPGYAQSSVEDIISGLIVDAGKAVTGWVPSFAANIAISAPEYLVITTVTIVASCYCAKDFEKIRIFARRMLKPRHRQLIGEIKDIAYKNIFKMLKSYALIMLITFVELSLGLLIIGVDNALLLALVIAFVDILPVLGCGTVLIPWGIVALIQGNFPIGIGVLLLYAVILVIRNIVEPKIVGEQVGLHPLITLLAIFVGFRFLGIIGMFALPIVAIILTQLYNREKLDFKSFFRSE